MDISINEILEQDPISESRITINENFQELKSSLELITDAVKLDPQNGTIDLTGAVLGTIKAKAITADQAVFPTTGVAKVTINKLNDGQIVALIGTIDVVTATNLTVTALLTSVGLRINGLSQLNGTVQLLKGFTKKRETISNTAAADLSKTISNTDSVLATMFSSSGYTLILVPNPTDLLLDGHELTILNVGPTASFNLSVTNIVGYASILLSGGAKSSVILHYNASLTKWYIVASNGVTLT